MAISNPFKNLSRPQLIASIAGAAGIGGYLVYKHHKSTGSWNPWSSAAASSSGSATSIDPVTGMAYSDDNATDPITGQTYLAEATQYGTVAAAEAAVSAFGASTGGGSGIGVNPASGAASGSPNSPVVGSSVYTSNAAWAQAATAGLADVGYTETDVATALGDYLTGTPVTPAQAQLINTAIAEYGPAPVGNLQVIIAPAATASPATGGSAPSTPSTPVKPPAKAPAKPAMPDGVSATGVTSSGFTLKWAAVPGATSYPVRITYQGALVWSQTAKTTSAKVTGLDANHTYTTHVAASNAAGTSSETNGPAVKTT